ncbi:MAG: hypothetical protein ACREID_04760, partial [Planctomycetota bacterium]
MASFRRTAAWSLLAATVLYAAFTTLGLVFITGHHNDLARHIVEEHRGVIAGLYARILVAYLAAGTAAALLLHPFAKGWKAAPAALGLFSLAFLHALTDETHLIYGPVQ